MNERFSLLDRSVSVQHAAESMDVSERTINELLERGELTGHYVGWVRRVYVHAIERYRDGNAIMPKRERRQKRRVKTKRGDAAIAALRTEGLI